MRAPFSKRSETFQEPTEEDIQQSLVRLDSVEVWAAKAYVFQVLPGYAGTARHGVVGLFRDGRVVYMETRGLAVTRMKPVKWWGHVDDLGVPSPPPKVFQAAKVMRVQRVQHRSLMLTIKGTRRIVCFTGLSTERHMPKLLSAGRMVVENLPHVGTVVQFADMGLSRAHAALHGDAAVTAANVWRSVLDGTVSPDSLPLWVQAHGVAHHGGVRGSGAHDGGAHDGGAHHSQSHHGGEAEER